MVNKTLTESIDITEITFLIREKKTRRRTWGSGRGLRWSRQRRKGRGYKMMSLYFFFFKKIISVDEFRL